MEAMLALRRIADHRVDIELVSSETAFHHRPLSVAEPFGLGEVEELPLEDFARSHGAHYRRAAISSVDVARKEVSTDSGATLSYDALVLATGARAREAVAGALTFRGSEDTEALRALLSEIVRGEVSRVAFVLPAGANWPVPLYELAVMTAAHLKRLSQVGAELTLVTHEGSPLELFGDRAAAAAAELLSTMDIGFVGRAYGRDFADRRLRLVPEGELAVDRVVAMPRLDGPALPGLPATPTGFIPTDRHGRVRGAPDVYAAGDVIDFPIKQGGLAAEQADAVAQSIAAWAGVPLEAEPFRPVLRGQLLTGAAPLFLRADLAGGRGQTSEVSSTPLWWPPTKLAGKHLGPALTAAGIGPPPPQLSPHAVSVTIDLDEVPIDAVPRGR